MAEMLRIHPIFPVRAMGPAIEHYRALGFTVEEYAGGDEYAFVTRDGIEIHLTLWAEMDPSVSASAAYLRVDSADELYEEWKGVGDTRAPRDTEYKIREGAHIDLDGNLIRFGSPLLG